MAGNCSATQTGERSLSPPVDIYETEEGLVLVADLPGLDDKSLELHVEQGVLTIAGKAVETLSDEFGVTGYWRQFQLPETIDTGQAEAKIENGVLTLHLPTAEAAKPRRIDVTVH